MIYFYQKVIFVLFVFQAFFLLRPWSFVRTVSRFVVLIYSRKIRLHAHRINFSIYFLGVTGKLPVPTPTGGAVHTDDQRERQNRRKLIYAW